ncbi:hypothetical protein ACFLU5_02765 [Bacteroidota bacterium]
MIADLIKYIFILITYAIAVGLTYQWLTRRTVDNLWIAIGWTKKTEEGRPHNWLPRIIGSLESIFYITIFLYGKPELIGFWLILKVAGKWWRWSCSGDAEKKIEDQGEKKIEGRAVYNIFLIGSAMNIINSFACSQLILLIRDIDKSTLNNINWLQNHLIHVSILLGTIFVNIFLYFKAKRQAKSYLNSINKTDSK